MCVSLCVGQREREKRNLARICLPLLLPRKHKLLKQKEVNNKEENFTVAQRGLKILSFWRRIKKCINLEITKP